MKYFASFFSVLIFFIFFSCQKNAKSSSVDFFKKAEFLSDSLAKTGISEEKIIQSVAQLVGDERLDSFLMRRLGQDFESGNDSMLLFHLDFLEKRNNLTPARKATCLTLKGIYHYNRSETSAAIDHFEAAKVIYTELRDTTELLSNAANLGLNYSRNGRMGDAFNTFLNGIALATAPKHAPIRADLQQRFAEYHVALHNFSEAQENSLAALHFFEKNKDSIQILDNLVTLNFVQAKKGDLDAALKTNTRGLNMNELLQKKGDYEYYKNRFLIDRGNILFLQKRWQSALDTLEKSRLFFVKNKELDYNFYKTELLRGRCLAELGQKNEAEKILTNVFEVSEKRHFPHTLRESSEALSVLFQQKGQFKASLFYFQKLNMLKDSLFDLEKNQKMDELGVRYKTHEKEQENKALLTENKLKTLLNWVIGLSSLLLTIAGIWFVHWRNKRKRVLLLQENELLSTRERLKTAELDAAKTELDLHRQQLDDFTMHLFEKNAQIDHLQQQLSEVETPNVAQSEGQNTQPHQSSDEDLDALFGQSLLTENDWERFKTYFERVFPGFMNRMKIKIPDLTAAEIRILLLTKMGLNTKEMGGILGISPESVKKIRYRFKRKIGVTEEEVLVGLK
jgi:tetratricopeptide (TPR) repeat protein/DNA-binding CsgD family transcriptional regulator